MGIIGASQLSRWVARRFGVGRSLRGAVATAVVAYATLWVAVSSGAGLWLVWPALFVGVSSYGIVAPNATAAAMGVIERDVGSASAVLGVLQSTCGALAAAAVSALADGTARPMAGVMLGCAGAAAVLVAAGGAGSAGERPRRPAHLR
jgi:DHA1 family bicyclomycin/chloramphenicol resistance-like MFS transporter